MSRTTPVIPAAPRTPCRRVILRPDLAPVLFWVLCLCLVLGLASIDVIEAQPRTDKGGSSSTPQKNSSEELRSNRTGLEDLHAWGLDVGPEGRVFVADATQDPNLIWSIPGAAFDLIPTGGHVEGWTLEEEAEPKVLVHGQGIRDLQVTPDGILYYSVATFGEDGEALSHGLKRRLPDGKFETVIADETEPRLFSGAPFRVDEDGYVYFYWLGRLYQRDTEGEARPVLGSDFRGSRDGGPEEARFNSVRAMAWAPRGELYLVDVASVRRVDLNGPEVSTVATRLIVRDGKRPPVELDDPQRDNRIYGITVDEDGRSWVAYYGDSEVLSVRRNGRNATYYSPSMTGWSPVGVVKTPDALFVAEVHGRVSRKLRVTRIDADGERSLKLGP